MSVNDQNRVNAPRAERWAGVHQSGAGLGFDGGGPQSSMALTVTASQRDLVRLSLLLRPEPDADAPR